jgi:hypothetical protein
MESAEVHVRLAALGESVRDRLLDDQCRVFSALLDAGAYRVALELLVEWLSKDARPVTAKERAEAEQLAWATGNDERVRRRLSLCPQALWVDRLVRRKRRTPSGPNLNDQSVDVYWYVKSVVDAADPVELYSYAPEDEYEDEIKDLVQRIEAGQRVNVALVASVMDYWWGDMQLRDGSIEAIALGLSKYA